MSASVESGACMPGALQVKINDEPRTVARGSSVTSLIAELGLADRKGVAIAINDTVVPRATWPKHALCAGDRVLVIRATQGG